MRPPRFPLLVWPLLAAVSLHAIAAPQSSHVPGFERLRAAGGDWQAEAGEILFSELSCAACHREPTPAQTPTFVWKAGPELSAAGDRLRADYVRHFLADPAQVKPGTTMPNLFASLEDTRKAELIEDLTHHLMGLRAKRKSQVNPVVGSEKAGKALYLSAGCVACHGSQPMPGLDEKYAPGELAKFLLNPLAVRPAGRMPDQHLGKKDVAHLAAYLAPKSKDADAEFAIDPERAARGRKAFASLGCVSCHGKEPSTKAPPIHDSNRGCLAAQPKAGTPQYALTDEQRGAIRTALTKRRASPEPLSSQAMARRIMLQRDCFACHPRDGLGGPTPDVAVHFTSTKDDLGDLGRLPPELTGVGRKLQPAALGNILRGRDLVRTYMRVRMPGFGDDLARELSVLFARADLREKPVPIGQNHAAAGRAEWGRELVGIRGYACISCHNINGHASLGIGAYDLAEMPKRLRPEWMREFLLNPAAFPTGSRMPPFWPEGQPMNPDLAGGTAESQIASIRAYLAEVDESLPPEGLADKATVVLKPETRPIVFRTFLKGTGTHAIAVGFPGEISAAFDALNVRWSMAWRGRFLDADGTWNQRYIKMEQPLGEGLMRLESAGFLSIVGREDLAPVFRGYHLRKDGVPVFDYDLGPLHIEDRVEPTVNRGLRRTLRVTGQTNESVRFSARPPANLQVKIDGHATMPVALDFQGGVAELVEEISW